MQSINPQKKSKGRYYEKQVHLLERVLFCSVQT